MARAPKGPLGNSPRDMQDTFVGLPAEEIHTGPPPKKPRNPQRITSNTFHAKVEGGTAPSRADRSGHFRRGGFVKGYQLGGSIARPAARAVAPARPIARTPLGTGLSGPRTKAMSRLRRDAGEKLLTGRISRTATERGEDIDAVRQPGYKRGGGIHIKPSHKGLLHKDLGVPQGEPIPASKLASAKHSSNPAVRKRATFAENAKKWNK